MAKELKPEEIIRGMIQSPAWLLLENEIKGTIAAIDDRLHNEDFKTLSDFEKIRGESKGLKRSLEIAHDLALKDNDEAEENKK